MSDASTPAAGVPPAKTGSWKRTALNAAVEADSRFDALRRRFYQRMGVETPFTICAYMGYGALDDSGNAIVKLRGRVLADPPAQPPLENESVWANLLATYRRLQNTQVPGARLQISLGGTDFETVTDSEGYYTAEFAPAQATASPWLAGTVRLLEPAAAQPITTPVHVIIPRSADFAVVSDIDDTILVSDATHLLRAARRLFLQSARSRLAFSGVADFYAALQRGAGPASFNPIFYLSASPWNLYDLLTDFMAFHNIPRGPILLRDFARQQAAPAGYALQGELGAHKLLYIEQLLADFPRLPFVLIGDSGQMDPEVYAAVAERHRDRIRAIYIRDVDPGTQGARDIEVQQLSRERAVRGVPMLLVDDSAAALAHAAQLGLVHAAV